MIVFNSGLFICLKQSPTLIGLLATSRLIHASFRLFLSTGRNYCLNSTLSSHYYHLCDRPPMTEYDFSPEAYERHLATQARIARWVDDTNSHSPENSFSPLPGNYESVVSYPHKYAAFAPHNSSPHSQPLSPTYSYHSFDSPKRHKSKRSGRDRRSLQPSPQFGQVVLPIAEGLYTMAKQAQLTQPRSLPRTTVRSTVRSSSTPIMGMPYHYPQTSHSQQYVIQPSHYPHARTGTMGTQPSIDPRQHNPRLTSTTIATVPHLLTPPVHNPHQLGRIAPCMPPLSSPCLLVLLHRYQE